jgi:hypothetical protein
VLALRADVERAARAALFAAAKEIQTETNSITDWKMK